MTTFIKIADAQQLGEYKPTSIDQRKKEVDFLIKSPNFIEWKTGWSETVSKRELVKLQKKFTWMTDY